MTDSLVTRACVGVSDVRRISMPTMATLPVVCAMPLRRRVLLLTVQMGLEEAVETELKTTITCQDMSVKTA